MLESVKVVLMGTSHPGNIGAVARAIKNMGITRLALVAPRAMPDDSSFGRAAGAADILDSLQVFDSLQSAVAGCSLVVGASARNRKIPWPVMNPRDCAGEICRIATSSPVAVVFGREDRGLTNEELQQCNFHVHIPSNPEFSSLNLAMAVQVVCYEIRLKYLEMLEDSKSRPHLSSIRGATDAGWGERPATAEELESFFEHLEHTIIGTGFLDPQNPRQLMSRLRRLFMRSLMDKVEINILRGILTSVDKLRH
jgi:tRNA (cytidine32/uridine32-2'-O)-methyltransferase